MRQEISLAGSRSEADSVIDQLVARGFLSEPGNSPNSTKLTKVYSKGFTVGVLLFDISSGRANKAFEAAIDIRQGDIVYSTSTGHVENTLKLAILFDNAAN